MEDEQDREQYKPIIIRRGRLDAIETRKQHENGHDRDNGEKKANPTVGTRPFLFSHGIVPAV